MLLCLPELDNISILLFLSSKYNVKENLEIYLTESNRLIKVNEKINKGIKALEKQKEKNMIKILSYISKVNKIKKEMNKILQEKMKNLKISYQEGENKIKYEEYYFSGIQAPKDIEVKITKHDNSIEVFWKIDNINIINIDNRNIKFNVEIRKENSNEKFKQIYEGSNKYCLIDNLIMDTSYEIRIYSIYDSVTSQKALIKNIKTSKCNFNCDSIILKESSRKNEFLKKIYEWSGYNGLELIYRGSRDGLTSKDFHNKCDNKGPTICLFKNEKGNIFGGYTSISWLSNEKEVLDENSFIFTLTNIHGTNPIKFLSDKEKKVKHHINYGPTFVSDIWIRTNFCDKNNDSDFLNHWNDSSGKGKSIFTGDLNNNNVRFALSEVEVFKPFE